MLGEVYSRMKQSVVTRGAEVDKSEKGKLKQRITSTLFMYLLT